MTIGLAFALTVQTHRVVLLGLQRLPIDYRVHAGEIGDRARVEFTVDVDEGAVVLRIVRAPRLPALLLHDRVVARVYRIITAHGLEGVGGAHEEVVRPGLHQDANVILAILLGRTLHDAHLHVVLRRVPGQPLLLRQVGQAEIVHEISETRLYDAPFEKSTVRDSELLQLRKHGLQLLSRECNTISLLNKNFCKKNFALSKIFFQLF